MTASEPYRGDATPRKGYNYDLSTPEAELRFLQSTTPGCNDITYRAEYLDAGLTHEQAAVLGRIVYNIAHELAKPADHLPGFFFFNGKYLAKFTRVDERRQEKVLAALKGFNLIELRHCGTPRQRYIRVNASLVQDILNGRVLTKKKAHGIHAKKGAESQCPQNRGTGAPKIGGLVPPNWGHSIKKESEVNHCPPAQGGADSVCPSVSGEGGPSQGLSSPETRGTTIKDKEEGLPSIKDSGAPETEKVRGGRSPVKNARCAPGYTQTRINCDPPTKKGAPIPTSFDLADRLRDLLFENKALLRKAYPRDNWAREIDRLIADLMERDSIDREAARKRVRVALKWLAANYGRDYCPAPNSATSFRDKFPNIERAMKKAERKRLGLEDDEPLPSRKPTKNVNFRD